MTKGQLKFAAVIAWLVMTGGGIYLGLIYINPIVVWVLAMGCPAALLLTLQKIDPESYVDVDDDDYEIRPRKNDADDEDDIFILPPPLTIGYGAWSVSDDD